MKAALVIAALIVAGYAVTASFGVATAKSGSTVIRAHLANIDAQ
jgi:hypothetical protein